MLKPSRKTERPEGEHGGIVPDTVVLELYQKVLTVLYVEERLRAFDRLGKVSFHASARGHEKLQIGITLLLKPRYDWFFTYYREKGIPIGLGMPLKDIFLGMLSRQSDPNSAGRNMPEHWSSREYLRVDVSGDVQGDTLKVTSIKLL